MTLDTFWVAQEVPCTCQAEGESNMSLGVGSPMTHGIMPFGGNLS